ncbi:hypothetical protein MAPG_10895 [Magnaporthiopsis poae ATCC 64411]|uniref:Uncharacterized protein n=1 Tax=Magnaporthiopsis poae (strain ATCC 64411 / 73-15) TaxID=644358 RepID=A0A0C4EDT5_MAGP6|nr:hypothetical protein MAPG_10895 [Magnaporthiopsis poae ATCC 64411]
MLGGGRPKGVPHPGLAFIKDPISSALRDWHATNEDLIKQLKELESMQPAIGRRLVWWYRHNDILAAMTKLRSEKDDLFALLLTYMSRHVPNSLLSLYPPPTSGANFASLQQAEHPVGSSLETRKDCTERDEPRYNIARDELLLSWDQGEPAVNGPSFMSLSAGSKDRDSGNKEEGNGEEELGEGDIARLAEGLELENWVILQ